MVDVAIAWDAVRTVAAPLLQPVLACSAHDSVLAVREIDDGPPAG
jgi:hypothetical protein